MKTVYITKDADGEYRVPGPDGREATAYYTDDKDDAFYTATNWDMYYGPEVKIKFRSVEVHPEGK